MKLSITKNELIQIVQMAVHPDITKVDIIDYRLAKRVRQWESSGALTFIGIIKALRQRTNWSLKEAKDFAEHHMDNPPT